MDEVSERRVEALDKGDASRLAPLDAARLRLRILLADGRRRWRVAEHEGGAPTR
jgi:hypothetical protein